MLADKLIVGQVRVGEQNPIDFRELAGTESFPFIKAPDTVEQPLAVKDFVQACDTTSEAVCCIKKRRVGIGDFYA